MTNFRTALLFTMLAGGVLFSVPRALAMPASAAQPSSTWVAGSTWKFTISGEFGAKDEVVFLRVDSTEADSCLGGNWKRLVLVTGAYKGIASPAYELKGDQLTILLTNDMCDSYDQLVGVVDGGKFVGKHIHLGYSATRVQGIAAGERID